MNKKGYLILLLSIVIIILIILGIILYPKYQEKNDIVKLNNEIDLVNKYLNGNVESNELENLLDKDVTIKTKELEKSIENYFNDVLISYSELINYTKIDKLDPNNINKELENKLNEKKIKVSETKENLDKIIETKNDYLTNIKYENIYKELIDKLNINYGDKINEFNNNVNKYIEVINFLNNNKNWKIEEEKIIFTKRNTYDNFNKIENSFVEYELIKDKDGPVISASNITITKGNKLNINDKIKCNDMVDDKVDCKIEGNFDVNKTGTYNIKISAVDKSNNKSNKTIQITVKEEKKNPYYIEVIRNQNIVIVYGLDSNNNYTKIIKVFTCSVGKNGKTPVGTFKTSDKAKWGWLVGNVYGQYYTRIVGDILFHSVPYYKKDKSTLEWEEYNKLGSEASKGCVRLAVRDVKWIYDNCPRGTTVKIYDGSIPNGVNKPSAVKISSDSPNKGWDPTDPDKNNPWKE